LLISVLSAAARHWRFSVPVEAVELPGSRPDPGG
jgi:hypothetical protein